MAGSYWGMAQVLIVSLPGASAKIPRLRGHVFDSGGACGAFTSRVVDLQCIRTTATCDYVCRPVDMGMRWYLCCYYRACYAFACIVDTKTCTSRRHP